MPSSDSRNLHFRHIIIALRAETQRLVICDTTTLLLLILLLIITTTTCFSHDYIFELLSNGYDRVFAKPI